MHESKLEAATVSSDSPTRRRVRLLKVYLTLARVLLSYGSLKLYGWLRGPTWTAARLAKLHRINARRVERTILEVGGLFIKVGQLISILTNFLPEEFREGLQGVQDRIPPRPYEEVAERIRSELGAPPEELFTRFERLPVASASLAQVHEAELADGRRLAVKVQHRHIAATAQLDLATIRNVLRVVQVVLRFRGIDAAYEEVRAMILDELDFAREAEHLREIAGQFTDDEMIRFPSVVEELSTRKVLTTSFVDGVKITDLAALEALGVDPRLTAERVLTAYCEMIFRHGTYHADPHPGNLLVTADGAVTFVDFGAVAELSPRMREGIPRFLEGVLRRDRDEIVGALRLMGFIPLERDHEVAEQVIAYFQRRFLEEITFDSWNLSDIQVDAKTKLDTILDLRRLDLSFRDLTSTFQVPKEWILLQRTLLLLLGLFTHLAPDLNPMGTIRPYLQRFVLGQDRDWSGLVLSAVKDLALAVFSLPSTLQRVLTKAEKGELELRISGLPEKLDRLYALGHQLLYGFFGVAAGAVWYHGRLRGDETLATGGAWAAGLMALLLLVSMVRAGRKRP